MGSPSRPKVVRQEVTPPPTVEDKAVQEEAARAANARKRARGYRSTIVKNRLQESGAPELAETFGR